MNIGLFHNTRKAEAVKATDLFRTLLGHLIYPLGYVHATLVQSNLMTEKTTSKSVE